MEEQRTQRVEKGMMQVLLANLDELQESQQYIKLKQEELLVKIDEVQRSQENVASTLSGIVLSSEGAFKESGDRRNEFLEKSEQGDKEVLMKVQVDSSAEPKTERKETRVCFGCGKVGHLRRDCFARERRSNRKGYQKELNERYASPLRCHRKSDEEQEHGENETGAE